MELRLNTHYSRVLMQEVVLNEAVVRSLIPNVLIKSARYVTHNVVYIALAKTLERSRGYRSRHRTI